MRLFCPYLRCEVEWNEERQSHISERHPDLLPDHVTLIAETLASPERIRRSTRFGNARLFSRWYPNLRNGKHVVVVVISDENASLHWVVTAYMAGKLSEGVPEWKQN